jgi:hypothetical protein
VQLGDLGLATEEIGASFFAEAFQAEPWALEVGQIDGRRERTCFLWRRNRFWDRAPYI